MKKSFINMICFVVLLAILGIKPTLASEEMVQNAQSVNNASSDDKSVECTELTPLKNYQCLKEQLNQMDLHALHSIQKIKKNIKSEWGAIADEEIRERVEISQEAWLKYREGYCSFIYFSKAPSHPPSEGERIMRCKINKTKERNIELEELYSRAGGKL